MQIDNRIGKEQSTTPGFQGTTPIKCSNVLVCKIGKDEQQQKPSRAFSLSNHKYKFLHLQYFTKKLTGIGSRTWEEMEQIILILTRIIDNI